MPRGQLLGFMTFIAPATFMMSFIEGTLLSVVPIFVVETLEVRNIAVVGAIGLLTLGLGGMAPFIARRLAPRRAIMLGVAASSAPSFLIAASSQVDAVALVVAAAALIGLTNGFILDGGTVVCGTIVPIDERGTLMSVLDMCAYAGTIPTVALGYRADAIGLTPTLVAFSVAAVAMALVVLVVGRRLFGQVVPHDHVVVPPPVARPAATA